MADDFVTRMSEEAEARRAARAIAHAKKYPHVVDQLILERAKNLSRSRWWPTYRVILNQLLGYQKAVRMVNEAGHLPGKDAFDYASRRLDLKLNLSGLDHIPREGPFLLAVNHPTGIADGVAIYDALKPIRPDMKFFANQDAVRLNERLTDLIIPVPWRADEKTRAKSRQTLVDTARTIKDGKALVLFPSGRIAFIDEAKLQTEQPWMNTVAAVPKKYEIPIIPAHMTGRNSWLYYWFWNVNEELRDMTLFHELLNKKGRMIDITFGPAISPDALPEDNDKAAAALRDYVSHHLVEGTSWADYLAARSG